MTYRFLISVFLCSILSCKSEDQNKNNFPMQDLTVNEPILLDRNQSLRLSKMALDCMQQEYPYKLGQVLANEEELGSPRSLHPAFYGCFDWHSAVHGHWLLVRILKEFPDIENRETIIAKLSQNISADNIIGELIYFNRQSESSFERTYGWAWLLKLSEEIATWDNPNAQAMLEALQPLADFIVGKYLDFLPRLVYPIRVGEHTNTAFGLCFAYDYAMAMHITDLQLAITHRAKDFYLQDQGCPIDWEPSGFDFLSPCLEEVDIMRRVLPKDEFLDWMSAFLPQLSDPNFNLEVAKVKDRSDGKLVHLDGANFSRAWVLYGLAKAYPEYGHVVTVADRHIEQSINLIDDGEYSGTHWLGSFAVYALTQK